MSSLNELFPGHCEPSKDELAVLWRDGVFVIDANVLLQLYALPEKTREETLSAFAKLGSRIWIPYQVALEYQRNRVRAIGQARDRGEKVVQPLETALQEFASAVAKVQLEKRGLEAATAKMKTLLECGESVISDAKSALASQVNLRGGDQIRDSLDRLFANHIGEAPTQLQLDQWYGIAKVRFEHRMGPGFEDSDKKNPTFMHAGIKYNRLYGDYVVWKQTIEHFKGDDSVKNLVVITQDRKPDWWQKYNEHVAGPHPALCAEMRSEAKLDRFWMYDLEEFLQEAPLRLQAHVSETTLSDVADANVQEEMRRSVFDTPVVERLRARRREQMKMSAQLIALGAELEIETKDFSAGPIPSMKKAWAIVVVPSTMNQFIDANHFGRLVRDVHRRGGREIHLYCLTVDRKLFDPNSALRRLIEYVDGDFYEVDMRVNYYAGDFEGNYELVAATQI